MVDDKARDGFIIARKGARERQFIAEFIDRHPARHQIAAVFALQQGGFLGQAFPESAGDRLKDIAGRDDTFEGTVFVIDQHHMRG